MPKGVKARATVGAKCPPPYMLAELRHIIGKNQLLAEKTEQLQFSLQVAQWVAFTARIKKFLNTTKAEK